MTMTKWVAMIMCSAALLGACSGQQDAASERAMPVDQTAFGDTVGTLDKARAVEDTSKQRMDQLNDALENSDTR